MDADIALEVDEAELFQRRDKGLEEDARPARLRQVEISLKQNLFSRDVGDQQAIGMRRRASPSPT